MKRAFVVFLLFVSLSILGGAVYMLILQMQGTPIPNGAMNHSPVVSCYVQLVVNILAVVFVWALKLIRRKPIPSKRPKLKAGIFALVGSVLLGLSIDTVVNYWGVSDGGTTQLFHLMLESPAGWLLLCFVGPISEELIFREGILRSLSVSGTAPWMAILVSSALFGVIHLNMMQGISAFALGCFLGILYVGTGDIRLSSAVHILNNILAVAMLQFLGSDKSNLPLWQVILISVVLLILGVLAYLYWWKKRDKYSFVHEMRIENPSVLF